MPRRVLTVIDLIRVIRIHRAAKREAKELRFTATGASAAEAADLVAEMRTMKSQFERLVEAQQRALEHNSAAGPSDGFDSTLHHSFSTMKREQSEALRETRPTATNLVVHTENGVELMAGPTVEQGPPEYSSNAGQDIRDGN
jgi:erythromycin esterase-like protein